MIPSTSNADMRLLGVSGHCSPDELKKAWRRAVSELHPDRPGSDQKQRAAAMAEVNAAYRRLCDFEARYGRLPGVTDVVASQDFRRTKPHNSRARHVLVALTLAAALTWLLWHPSPPDDAAPPALAFGGPETGFPADQAPETAETFVDLDLPSVITVGVSKDDVLRLAGPPLFQSDAVWEYGPSEVRFEDDLVVRWHSSPLRPLPVRAGAAGLSP